MLGWGITPSKCIYCQPHACYISLFKIYTLCAYNDLVKQNAKTLICNLTTQMVIYGLILHLMSQYYNSYKNRIKFFGQIIHTNFDIYLNLNECRRVFTVQTHHCWSNTYHMWKQIVRSICFNMNMPRSQYALLVGCNYVNSKPPIHVLTRCINDVRRMKYCLSGSNSMWETLKF